MPGIAVGNCVGGGRHNDGMTELRTLDAWLATLAEHQLADVIDASPLAQAGSRLRSVDELAQRLCHPANVARVLRRAPLPVLEIVEATSALGEAADVASLTGLLDAAGAASATHAWNVDFWLAAAQQGALLWRDGERLHVNPGVDALVAEPLAIGRPARILLATQNSDGLARLLGARGITAPPRKAERLTEALSAFSDLQDLRRLVGAAPQQVLQTLEEHVLQRLSRVRCRLQSYFMDNEVEAAGGGLPAYYVDGMIDQGAYRRERDRGEWVEAAGLAAGIGGWSYQFEAEMPSEVLLALAPPSFRVPFHGDRPHIALAPVAREQMRRGSAAALAHLVTAAMTIFEDIARNGLLALKRGGIGTRELARLAKDVGEDVPTVRLAVELGFVLGLFHVRGDGRLGASPQFDPWRRRPPHEQAFDLVSQWLMLEYVPTAERDEAGSALPALAGDAIRTGLPNGVLLTSAIASVTRPEDASEAASTIDDVATVLGVAARDEIVDFLVWNHPMVPTARVAFTHTWAEAELLGVVVDGAVAPVAEAIRGEGEAAALAILERDLPTHNATALFGSDLTVVVAGNPTPDVVDVLTLVADRESHGVANTWRAGTASVRSALDSGYAADDLTDALRDIAGGDLPQAWEYLIADTARKHGRLRVAGAAAVIVCQDEALLAEVVSSRALRAMGLSMAAPTVAVSRVAPAEALRRLREAGFLPVETGAGGAPVVALQPVPGAPQKPGTAGGPPPDERAAQSRARGDGVVVPLFADEATLPRRGESAETAADLAARLLSSNPDSNPRPGEVNDIADVEQQIRSFNGRLSTAEVHELADAETRVRPVMIRYRSQTGRDSLRMISQMSLVGDSLFAYCHLRNAERVFRLGRIVEVAPV